MPTYSEDLINKHVLHIFMSKLVTMIVGLLNGDLTIGGKTNCSGHQ